MMRHSSNNLSLVLINIRSVYNTAAIFRTADGAGIKKIYLAGITPSPNTPLGLPRKDFVKISLGAERNISFESYAQPLRLVKKLKAEGARLVALELSDKSVDFRSLRITAGEPVAIILGNEVDGIPPKILNLCDDVAQIPMRGGKESLNVSVAAGIFMYHICDQWYDQIKK